MLIDRVETLFRDDNEKISEMAGLALVAARKYEAGKISKEEYEDLIESINSYYDICAKSSKMEFKMKLDEAFSIIKMFLSSII